MADGCRVPHCISPEIKMKKSRRPPITGKVGDEAAESGQGMDPRLRGPKQCAAHGEHGFWGKNLPDRVEVF
ncbi:hypothetical protein A3768_5412 (plasmid) [Ralstonia solanacearum]|nr:hypothetical protein F504_3833 [Ralstonia pseudosolanacearum FQY_4]ANH36194.1 hypothetical protein A3768_5412 [Ralstonia solanacearum]